MTNGEQNFVNKREEEKKSNNIESEYILQAKDISPVYSDYTDTCK
jgi:hypothetical protein